jgi:RNA polymerase sigma-70 factor (ECF subfamily)
VDTVESQNLERLVRSAQAGEPRAFDRLAAALLPRVRRWALAHVQSADDAEDIAQEVLLKTHRALTGFAFGSRITTWLYSVTRRTAADFHRKNSRRTRLLEGHFEPRLVNDATVAGLDHTQLTEQVLRAFRKLPNRQREIFDLADLQGIPLHEIAELLQMKPVTARVHLHRARATIRTRILEEHPALVEDLS